MISNDCHSLLQVFSHKPYCQQLLSIIVAYYIFNYHFTITKRNLAIIYQSLSMIKHCYSLINDIY